MILTHTSICQTQLENSIAIQTNIMENTPIYSHNLDLNSMSICYGEKTYLFDYDDFCKVLNHNRNFTINLFDDIYPSYTYNSKQITYLNFLYSDEYNENYKFINGNKYDLRRCNVILCHKKDDYVRENYHIIKYIKGHYSTYRHAGIMKNPLWHVNIDGNERILMYCEPDILCILCPESYQKICNYELNNCNGKKLTFYKNNCNYIASQINSDKCLMIHQIIMDHYGNGKGTKLTSVDHIDRNPLNNCLDNLRIVGHDIQQKIKKGSIVGTKRERRCDAQELPEGIRQSMLRKYVVYNKEIYNKSKNLVRDYFRIDHPSLTTPWESSKSNKVSILDKLNEANRVAEDLENGIMPNKKERELPKYFRFEIKNDKTYLIFDRRYNEKRCNMQITLNSDTDIDDKLEKMRNMLIKKYDENVCF